MYCFPRALGNGIAASFLSCSWLSRLEADAIAGLATLPLHLRVYLARHREVCWHGTPVGGAYMKTKFASLLMAGMLLAGAVATTTPVLAQSMPKVGDMAPDFSLKYFTGSDLKDVKLSDYRGKKNVVLAFYVFAFTGG